jgi:prevent-host-death family protein
MTTVNVHEAKTNLSKLLRRVEQGEEIVIARDGTPVVRLVAFRRGPARLKPGAWKGRFRTPDDFNAPLPDDLLDAFEGRR